MFSSTLVVTDISNFSVQKVLISRHSSFKKCFMFFYMTKMVSSPQNTLKSHVEEVWSLSNWMDLVWLFRHFSIVICICIWIFANATAFLIIPNLPKFRILAAKCSYNDSVYSNLHLHGVNYTNRRCNYSNAVNWWKFTPKVISLQQLL